MKKPSHQDQATFKQRILETTLVAVRDKKKSRKKKKTTIVCATITLIAIIVVLNLPTPNSFQTVTSNAPNPAIHSIPPPLNPSKIEVSMATVNGVRTVDISPTELAKIVFDPNFEFTENEDAYTWESKSMLIHMSLPTTTLAITDTRY